MTQLPTRTAHLADFYEASRVHILQRDCTVTLCGIDTTKQPVQVAEARKEVWCRECSSRWRKISVWIKRARGSLYFRSGDWQ